MRKDYCLKQVTKIFSCLPLAILVVLLLSAASMADRADDAFNFATGLLINKDYQAALDEYSNFLKANPNHGKAPEAMFRRGECLFRLDRQKEAIEALAAYEKAHPKGEHRPISAWWRGEMLLKANEPAAAADAFSVIVQNFPEHALAPMALYWRGEGLSRAGKFDEAVNTLKQSLEKANGEYRPLAISSLGWAEFQRGNLDEALKHFRALTANHPEHEAAAPAAMQIATILVQQGKPDEAQQAYDLVSRKYGDRYGRAVLTGRAQMAFDRGEFARAGELFQKAAADYPDDPAADATRMNAAAAWFRAGDFQRASALFAQSSKNQAIAHEALFWQGKCLEAQGKYSEALPLFNQAAATQDAVLRSRSLLGRGDAQLALEQYDGAVESYLSAAQAAPATEWAFTALFNAAFARNRQERIDEAVVISRDLLGRLHGRENEEIRGRAAYALGEYLFRKGDFAEADKVFSELIVKPTPSVSVSSASSRRAWCRFRLNKHDEARAFFAGLLEAHPQSPEAPEAAYMIGHILAEQGKYEEAIAAFEACRKNYANSEFAGRASVEIGVCLFRLRKFDEAATALGNNSSPRARLYLAETALERGQSAEAERIFTEILRQELPADQSAAALMGLGFALRAQNKFGAASEKFIEYVNRHPERADAAAALFQAARSLEQAGNSAGAIEQYARLQREYAQNSLAADAAFRQSMLMARTAEDAAQGVAALDQFTKQYPTSAYIPDVIYERAWLLRERGARSAAFEELLKRFPDHPLASDAAFRLGEFSYADRDFDNAIKFYLRALQNENSAAERDKVYYKLGWAQLEKDDKAQALAAFSKVANDFAKSEVASECALRAGIILRESGKSNEAEAMLVKVSGDFAHRALFERGQIALQADKPADAWALFEEALKTGAKSDVAMEIRLGMGYAQIQMGAHKDAEATMTEIIRNCETITAARAQYALGEIFYSRKEYSEAGREFLKVAFLYGYEEWKLKGYLMAGSSFEQAGEKERALLYYREAVKLAPESEEGKEAAKAVQRLGG